MCSGGGDKLLTRGRSDRRNTSLKDVDLSWNRVTAKGGCTLAESITFNKTLTVLDLGWNGIGAFVVIFRHPLSFFSRLKRRPNREGGAAD